MLRLEDRVEDAIILRPNYTICIQLIYTRQADLTHLFLYSTLKTLAWLSHFMDSLQDSGSSILVAPVSSYRLLSAAIGARDTGSRGEIQVLLSFDLDQCGSSSNNIRSSSDHRAQEASYSTEV